jgi:hypothetical protein
VASTISAARGALYDLLAAAAGLSGVQVTFGMPSAYEEQEVVALMGVEAPDEEPAVIGGARPRDEVFTIVVAVKAHDPAADTAQTVDARCWALADEVREVVYANQTLSGALSQPGWARIVSQTSAGAMPAEGGGWVAFAEIRVLSRARIA